ncbi:hypothetical protein AB1K32_13305 [Metabacillus dongyingensis]|uniref:hypothetical protein n=1 Tax=Metabacillus dongyingensis TaxID=2874282 RepID=UPI003B8D9F01
MNNEEIVKALALLEEAFIEGSLAKMFQAIDALERQTGNQELIDKCFDMLVANLPECNLVKLYSGGVQ